MERTKLERREEDDDEEGIEGGVRRQTDQQGNYHSPTGDFVAFSTEICGGRDTSMYFIPPIPGERYNVQFV